MHTLYSRSIFGFLPAGTILVYDHHTFVYMLYQVKCTNHACNQFTAQPSEITKQ